MTSNSQKHTTYSNYLLYESVVLNLIKPTQALTHKNIILYSSIFHVVFENIDLGIDTIFTGIGNALGDAIGGGAAIDLADSISSSASDAWGFITLW